MNPGDLSKAERAEYIDRIMTDLEGTKNLGPEYFTLRTKLITQTGREYLAEVEARRGRR